MQSSDDTQPRSPFHGQPSAVEGQEIQKPAAPRRGPGCLVRLFIGVLGLGLAAVVVLLATMAGWNEGLQIARANATAEQGNYVATQCGWIASDLNEGRLELAQRRFEDLAQQTPAVECLSLFAPTATALHLINQPTETATASPSPTQPSTSTQPPTTEATTISSQATVAATPESTSGFDLSGLLTEAKTSIAAADWNSAIDTLDAIIAIDPAFSKAEVEQLLFGALTSEATRLYRNGGGLAEAIVLTDRAEEFGDIGELNYERFIASIYLDSQRYINLNYPDAIRLLERIVFEQNLPNYRNGEVRNTLINQYTNYGDSLMDGNDACSAVAQYNKVLQLSPNSSVTTKRDQANIACSQGSVGTPAATLEPGIVPSATLFIPPTATVAPIGSR